MAARKSGKSSRKRARSGGAGAARRGRSRRGASRRPPRGRGRLRTAMRVFAAIAFVLGFALATWVIRLDRIVVSRFEGERFRVPSKVLSAPTILYPGLDLGRDDLEATLVRLGYREHSGGQKLRVGTFQVSGARARIHLRAFDHPSRSEPERRIGLRFERGAIGSLVDLDAGREVGAVLLEPELVGAYYGPDREQRDLVRLEDVPPHVVDAILAVEDQRFETHHGIDPRRILGALLANLRAGEVREGASTLTQQLVKNFFLTPERTVRRKAQEAVMALLVELRYDKQAILESYLNEIYLGQRGATAVHGVGEAARLYFGKPVRRLGVAEAALIAAIIQSPNRISPHHNLELGTRRRNLVLRLMRDQGRIDEATYLAARVEPLRVAVRTPELGQSRYFLDVLRRQLPDVYDRDLLSAEGLRIYSTLDPRHQRAAADALRRGLEQVEERTGRTGAPLQGCLVALRPQTGEIVALVGGRDYGQSQFDRCSQARRPVGSVFKPFVYIAALERDPLRGGAPLITLASFLDDSPLEIDTPSGPWRPRNYDRQFRGRVPVREALERSLNAASARLGQQVGIRRVVDVARRMGIESSLPRVPSLALGTAEVSPLELARAYATLANGGTRPVAHTFEDVVDQTGARVERRRIELERVLDPGTAYLTTSLLEGVVERGTAARVRSLGIDGPVAAKTGTTDEERDLWFVGYTPELVAVVWVGYDEPSGVGLPASQVALPIWVQYVREAVGTDIRGSFLPPAEVHRVDIEPTTGHLALSGCPLRRGEYFLMDTEPQQTCPEGGSRWREGDRGFFDWFRELL